ncbi:hypothetical protein ACLESD_49690, partial [Pyxidicoccus sp. 3LFB2]
MFRIRDSQLASLRVAVLEARVEQLVDALLAEPAPSEPPAVPPAEAPWTRERLRPVVCRMV